MAVVFTVLMVMAGIYALFKWPIPTLAVLGVLIVIGKSGENKNGGTAPTTAPPPAKPKAPSSPIKPQAVQPTVQAQPKAPEVRKAYTAPSMKELLYPAEVPTFAELAEGKHKDPRALIYTIANLDPEKRRLPKTNCWHWCGNADCLTRERSGRWPTDWRAAATS